MNTCWYLKEGIYYLTWNESEEHGYTLNTEDSWVRTVRKIKDRLIFNVQEKEEYLLLK